MLPVLYAHPFSSYCQKVLIALYENGTPFTYRVLGPDDPSAMDDLAALWPLRRFPLMVHGERTILEATTIVEYLDRAFPGATRFVPQDPDAAIEVRMMDRVFDNYVMTPMQKIVLDRLREEKDRDAFGVTQARTMLDTTYAWLDGVLAGREWAAAGGFSLADCAAAPALLYADWAHPIGDALANLRAYRARLVAHPSYARALDEARPFRQYFPLGDPGRD